MGGRELNLIRCFAIAQPVSAGKRLPIFFLRFDPTIGSTHLKQLKNPRLATRVL